VEKKKKGKLHLHTPNFEKMTLCSNFSKLIDTSFPFGQLVHFPPFIFYIVTQLEFIIVFNIRLTDKRESSNLKNIYIYIYIHIQPKI
jgi:hypothetical protein